MNVVRILETDVIAKAIAAAPTADGQVHPSAMDLANMFGDLHMRILADLDPIDLLYMVESNHDLTYTIEDDERILWMIDLFMIDVAYHTPTAMMKLIFDGEHPSNIYTNPEVLAMMSNTLSAESQNRFSTNSFINPYIKDDFSHFDGWTMHYIGINGSDRYVSPVAPTYPCQVVEHSMFEKAVQSAVDDMVHVKSSETVLESVFSKRVTFDEFLDLVRNQTVKVKNVSYGLRELIKNGYIPENLYKRNVVKNILGVDRETLEYDHTAVCDIIRQNAKVPVVIQTMTTYQPCIPPAGRKAFTVTATVNNPFDQYVKFIMDDNFTQACDNYPFFEQHDSSDTSTDETVDVEQDESMDSLLLPDEDDATPEEEIISLLDELDSTEKDDSEETVDIQDTDVQNSESVPNESDADSQNAESVSDNASEFTFFYCNATFDTIQQIENNPKYQTEDTIGVICMDSNAGGVPQTYCMGRPIIVSGSEMTKWQWTEISHDKLFEPAAGETTVLHKVRYWYDKNGVLHENVVWEDYTKSHFMGAINEVI